MLIDHARPKPDDNAILSTHCRNDLGMAAWPAVSCWCSRMGRQVTINGIGENVREIPNWLYPEEITPDYQVNVRNRCQTNISRTERFIRPAVWYQFDIFSTFWRPQPNKAIVGRKPMLCPFKTGIHRMVCFEECEKHEIIDPHDAKPNIDDKQKRIMS